MEKVLGKIESVHFGFCGYQDMMIGLSLSISMQPSSGVCAQVLGWWSTQMEITKHTKWTESDRDQKNAAMLREVDKLLQDAKVREIHQLKGKPVECVFDAPFGKLVSWRILTEVL